MFEVSRACALRPFDQWLQSQIQSLSANMVDTMEGDGSGMFNDSAKLESRELAQQHKVREFDGHHDNEDFVKSAQLDITTSKMVPQWVTGVLVILFWRSFVWHWEKHTPQR